MAVKDLTRGKPLHLIFSFGVPILFGFLFQQCYNLTDTAIVGRYLGKDALAAVGSTGSINFLIIGFVMGVCNGFAIPIAQMFGANDWKQLRRYVANAIWLCVAFAAVFTVLTLVFCSDILSLMQTNDEIFHRARTYISTIFFGIPGFFLYNMSAGILNSLGDSKTPVRWIVVSSIINIVLDLVFIIVFHMDVFGAALATVIAQFISGFGCLHKLCRDYELLQLEREDLQPSFRHIARLFEMGLPMGLQYSITGIGSIVLQTSVNQLGTDAVAAITASNKLSAFMTCPFDAMGSTMATYAGQNVGAKQWDRLGKGLGTCVSLGAIYSVFAFALMFLCGDDLVALFFLNEESMHLKPLINQFLITVAAFYFLLALVNSVRFFIQGMGFPPIATFAGVLEMFGRGGVAYLVGIFGFSAACFASPAAWLLADLFLIPAFFICRSRLLRKHNAQLQPKKAVSANQISKLV